MAFQHIDNQHYLG